MSRVTLIRLVLFLLGAAVAIVVGFFAFPPLENIKLVRFAGYWVLLATFVWFLTAAILHVRKNVPPVWWRQRTFWLAALVVLAGSGFVHLHEKKEFKIMVDEAMLVTTAHQMHETRQVFVPSRVHLIRGIPSYLNGTVNKRPFFYPLLVSIVHDLTGYRVSNAFWVNGLLTVALLTLTFLFAKELGGWWAAVAAVALWASVPHLARTASGANFELLNLVMITTLLWLSLCYLRQPDRTRLSLLLLASVLLINTRYESAIFLLPVGAVVLLGWRKNRAVAIPNAMIAAPLLLIPFAWLLSVFQVNEDNWEMFSKPGTESPFGFAFIGENLLEAYAYFFDFSRYVPNNPWVAIAGVVALLFFVLHLVKSLRSRRQPVADPSTPVTLPQATFAIFLVGFGALFLLFMMYFFGQFTDGRVQRLALPFYIPLILATVFVVFALRSPRWLRSAFALGLALSFLIYSIPVISSRTYSHAYKPSLEAPFLEQFRESVGHKRFLLISHNSGLSVPYGDEFLHVNYALVNEAKLDHYLHHPVCPPVYVFEIVRWDPKEEEYFSQFKRLPETWVTEEVRTVFYDGAYGLRILRLHDIEGVEAPVYKPGEHGELRYWGWFVSVLP